MVGQLSADVLRDNDGTGDGNGDDVDMCDVEDEATGCIVMEDDCDSDFDDWFDDVAIFFGRFCWREKSSNKHNTPEISRRSPPRRDFPVSFMGFVFPQVIFQFKKKKKGKRQTNIFIVSHFVRCNCGTTISWQVAMVNLQT
jgi:hypothetical protein